MRIFGTLIIVVITLSSCHKQAPVTALPDLLVHIHSNLQREYALIMSYPIYTACPKEEYNPTTNKYVALFSLKKDSSEYLIRNFNNMQEHYFTLSYKHQIIENYKENDIKITFYDFKVSNCSADSFAFKNNELWIYCD